MTEDELLQRYHDGELEPEQCERVRALVARDPSARARLERLALVGSLVRELARDSEHALPADFTDRIMARIGHSPQPQASAAPVTPLRRSRLTAVGAAAAALAFAAAAALWLRAAPPHPLALHSPSTIGGPVASPPAEAALASAAFDAPPVAIESVDFGATRGAIFLVSAGVTDTMVVWTLDEPPDGLGR